MLLIAKEISIQQQFPSIMESHTFSLLWLLICVHSFPNSMRNAHEIQQGSAVAIHLWAYILKMYYASLLPQSVVSIKGKNFFLQFCLEKCNWLWLSEHINIPCQAQGGEGGLGERAVLNHRSHGITRWCPLFSSSTHGSVSMLKHSLSWEQTFISLKILLNLRYNSTFQWITSLSM